MTSVDHNSGTERLWEVCDKYKIPADEIVVNVQGDEPLIPSENIKQVCFNATQTLTLCKVMESQRVAQCV